MSQLPQIKISEMRSSEPALSSVARAEPTDQARLAEIENTMRELLRARRAEEQRPRSSKLALIATALALAALLCSAGQAYYSWSAYERATDSARSMTEFLNSLSPGTVQSDTRTQVTIPELAKRAPSIRSGNIQAWWAGEQARQVQRLEAQAKRQTLAGDREGAARSVTRADHIRGAIPSLAEFEKRATR